MKQKIGNEERSLCCFPNKFVPVFYVNRSLCSVKRFIQYLSSKAKSLKINELTHTID